MKKLKTRIELARKIVEFFDGKFVEVSALSGKGPSVDWPVSLVSAYETGGRVSLILTSPTEKTEGFTVGIREILVERARLDPDDDVWILKREGMTHSLEEAALGFEPFAAAFEFFKKSRVKTASKDAAIQRIGQFEGAEMIS